MLTGAFRHKNQTRPGKDKRLGQVSKTMKEKEPETENPEILKQRARNREPSKILRYIKLDFYDGRRQTLLHSHVHVHTCTCPHTYTHMHMDTGAQGMCSCSHPEPCWK